MSADVVEQELVAWSGDAAGGQVVRVERIAGGNRRRAVLLDIARPDGTVVAGFLRFAAGLPPKTADPYTLWREAAVYRALQGRGIAIPRLIATHQQHQAMLVERVAGHADYSRLGEAERAQVAEEFLVALVRLHRVDIAALGLEAPSTRTEANRRELAIWRAMYAETGRSEPLIAFALRWLEEQAPVSDAPPVLAHGDAGPGNLLIDGGHMIALIDWELWHFGDPVEDIAWASFRSTIQPIPNFEAFLARYAALSGTAVDRALLRYHRAFVATRILIVRHRDQGALAAESDAGNSLISLTINRRAALTEIAAACGHRLPSVPPIEPDAAISTRLHAFVIDSLKATVAPRSSDSLVLARTRSLVRVMKYLREDARLGAAARALDVADRARLLGAEATDDQLASAIEQGALSIPDILDLLWRRVAREGQIAAPALGVLAGRDYPAI